MYNSGGAVEALGCVGDQLDCQMRIKGKGCGQFGALSSVKPRACYMNSEELEFKFVDPFLEIVIPTGTGFGDINIPF